MYVVVGEDGSWKVVNLVMDFINKKGKEKGINIL